MLMKSPVLAASTVPMSLVIHSMNQITVARCIRQDGDSEELIQEAIDTCPVDCIHWLDHAE